MWILNGYYLLNLFVCFIYPAYRIYVNYTNDNFFYKSSTYSKENHIIFSFSTMVLLKLFRQYTSFKQILSEFFFYSKLGTIFLFFFLNYSYCIWYSILVVSVWVLVKVPRYSGPSKIIPIQGNELFTKLVKEKKKNSHCNNYAFVIYHSVLSDKCIFVRFYYQI